MGGEPQPGSPAGGPEDLAEGVGILLWDHHLEASYTGDFEVERFKRQMLLSVRAAADRGRSRLLVDVQSLRGYTPTTTDRYEFGAFGAKISQEAGLSRVAILGTREQLKDTFASTVARNRGLFIQSFTDRGNALAWLLGELENG